MRRAPVVIIVTAVLAALLGGCTGDADRRPASAATVSASSTSGAAAPSAAAPGATTGAPAPPAPSGPLFNPAAQVTMSLKGHWSWSYLDFASGQAAGSTPYTTSDTASMSKAWVAADYLRRAAEKKQQPSGTVLAELTKMIRDSDTTNTFKYHVANGNLTSIKRMITLCGLSETKGTQNSWSLTQMSARDVARLGKCIGDGRAAGPKWTGWLLNEMRNVRGAGRFGIIEALPADVAKTVAIKNGWLAREDGNWHIACMAVGEGWSIGVMARYPSGLGKDYGAKTCREVTKQLLTSR